MPKKKIYNWIRQLNGSLTERFVKEDSGRLWTDAPTKNTVMFHRFKDRYVIKQYFTFNMILINNLI